MRGGRWSEAVLLLHRAAVTIAWPVPVFVSNWTNAGQKNWDMDTQTGITQGLSVLKSPVMSRPA